MNLDIKSLFISKVVEAIGGQKYLSLQIDITNACNLQCVHCYHSNHKNTGALTTKQWFSIFDQYEALIKKLYLRPAITICGGEPLISPNLAPIIEELNKRFPQVKIYILTNGTRINEAIIEQLKPYNIAFQISLDGPNAERHDLIRGNGNFKKAIEGAKIAREHNIETLILSILSRRTSQWIPDFFEMAKSLNVNAMNFTRFIPVGYGENLVNRGLDDVLIGYDLKEAMESIIKNSIGFQVRSNTNQALYNLIDPKLGAHGKFGFQGLVIDYKGNLKVSSRISYTLGSVIDEGLENLFLNHPVMKSLRKGEIAGCGQCEHYSRCGGDRNMSFAITGNFLSQDIGCWLKPATLKREGA